MKRRLVLHIGMPKCGSTSIQQFLFTAKTPLAKRNIFVPDELNFDNSWRLSAASLKLEDTEYFRNTLRVFGSSEYTNVKSTLSNDLKRLRLKLDGRPDYSLVISSEYLYSQAVYGYSIEELHTFFNNWFDEIDIVFVTKDPYAILKSMYAQFIQGPSMGAVSFKEYLNDNTTNPIYDFSQLLGIWKSVFDKSTLRIINLDTLSPTETLTNAFEKILYRERASNDIKDADVKDDFDEQQSSLQTDTISNKSLGYGNLVILRKVNGIKKRINILKELDFNNPLIRTIRVLIRFLPLNKKFPSKPAGNSELKKNYDSFLKQHGLKGKNT